MTGVVLSWNARSSVLKLCYLQSHVHQPREPRVAIYTLGSMTAFILLMTWLTCSTSGSIMWASLEILLWKNVIQVLCEIRVGAS